MAYFGGSATEGSIPRIDFGRIIAITLTLLLIGSLSYLLLHPEKMQLPVQEKIVIREVPVASTSQEVFVAKSTIWAGQKLNPLLFNKEFRSVQGMETQVITDPKDITGVFATSTIAQDTPVLKEFVTAVPPKNALTARIPAGYRAVTISVNAESGVEGWARAGVRVDVVWNTSQRGKQIVTTILENVQIISAERSVASNTDANGMPTGSMNSQMPSHVTLLVSTQDAPKIELAKTSGTLALLLRGDADSQEVGTTTITVDRMLKGDKSEALDDSQGRVVIDGKEFVVRGKKMIPAEQIKKEQEEKENAGR